MIEFGVIVSIFAIAYASVDMTLRLVYLAPRYEQFKQKYDASPQSPIGAWRWFGFMHEAPLSSEQAWRKRLWVNASLDIGIILIAVMLLIVILLK